MQDNTPPAIASPDTPKILILAYQQTTMDQQIIKDALYSALTLLNNEVESVIIPELSEEYFSVIEKIENALKEF